MDLNKVKQLRADIDAALKAVAAKHNVDFTLGRLVYDAGSVRGKLQAIERNMVASASVSPAAKATPDEYNLTKKAYLLGSKYVQGTLYFIGGSVGRGRIVGYRATAKKYPWIVERATDGAKFKISTLSAKMAIEAATAK